MNTSLLLALAICVQPVAQASKEKRPNIIWMITEDMSPNLGCYGDSNAITPNLDKLASQGARFNRCFSHAPVCAPSRSGLMTCRYPTAIGSHHMRSKLISPPVTFTEQLRKAGYFVTWPGKTDTNFNLSKDAFDSTKEWIKSDPPKQPFFAQIHFQGTHESQIRHGKQEHLQKTDRLKPSERHDPAKMVVPPYYPDTPEVRQDIAYYYDNITQMDYRVGDVMKYLKEKGLADNTVVFFFGDHGWGMPRGKRWIYDTGTRTALLVRWPGRIAPATVREDLVAFVDLGVTCLAIAGAEIPTSMDGVPFLTEKSKPRKYVYAARDRMDETYDRIRGVRDERFQYIRNYHPELPYAQRIQYMELMPTMQAWRKANAEGTLTGAQKLFFAPTKPAEELYDCQDDPHQVNNLAKDPKYSDKLTELRNALDQWIASTKDMGAIPEKELIRQGLVEDVLSSYENRKQKK